MRHLIPAGDMEEVRRNLGASTGPLNPCDSSSCWHACCAGDVPKLGQIPVEPHVICAKLLAASCAFADMTPGATPICRNCHVPKFSRPTSMVPVIAALVQAGHLTKSKRPDPWNSLGPEDVSSTQGSSRSQSQDREQTLQQTTKHQHHLSGTRTEPQIPAFKSQTRSQNDIAACSIHPSTRSCEFSMGWHAVAGEAI